MSETKFPPWYSPRDAFTADVKMSDLGFQDLVIKDPPQGKFQDLVHFEKKNPDNRIGWNAMHLITYFSSAAVGEVTLNGYPKKDAPFNEWKQWVAEAPSKVVGRILTACMLMREDDVPN